mgnify:CR=1 FL=1
MTDAKAPPVARLVITITYLAPLKGQISLMMLTKRS